MLPARSSAAQTAACVLNYNRVDYVAALTQELAFICEHQERQHTAYYETRTNGGTLTLLSQHRVEPNTQPNPQRGDADAVTHKETELNSVTLRTTCPWNPVG